jgi:hypothetical protein
MHRPNGETQPADSTTARPNDPSQYVAMSVLAAARQDGEGREMAGCFRSADVRHLSSIDDKTDEVGQSETKT